jgi:hypothetical protein
MEIAQGIEMNQKAASECIKKFRDVESKYASMDHRNQKYVYKKMGEEMDLALNYKLIKAKIEAKIRRDEIREIFKTRVMIKQRLVREMKALKIAH